MNRNNIGLPNDLEKTSLFKENNEKNSTTQYFDAYEFFLKQQSLEDSNLNNVYLKLLKWIP